MDSSKIRGIWNRNRKGPKRPITNIRRRLNVRTTSANRWNLRQGIINNIISLAKTQSNLRTNKRGPQHRFRRFNNYNNRRKLHLWIVYISGLPNIIDNRRLYSLFRKEERIKFYIYYFLLDYRTK